MAIVKSYWLFIFSLIFSSCLSDDKTLKNNANGHDVVCAVIKKISDSGVFPDDKGILRRIAWVESKFGNDPVTYRDDSHGGIWKINEATFKMITKTNKLANLNAIIFEEMGINMMQVNFQDLIKPLYSGLFARMSLYIVNEVIPENYDLDGQAQFWKIHYNTGAEVGTEEFSEEVTKMEKEHGQFCDECKGRMNLAIVMDGSGSIGGPDFEFARTSVINLINTFAEDYFDIGFVVFSDNSQIIFPLKSRLTRDEMKEKIRKSPYPGSGTSTNLGIDDGIRILNNATKRAGVPKVMAVFTDGRPNNPSDVLESVESARRSNITIVAVGIGGNIDQANLLQMAKKQSRVMMISSYKALSWSFNRINSQTCRVTQNLQLGMNVTDKLDKSEKRYYSLPLIQKGITVRVESEKGGLKGYYSYTEENPSSAVNDGEFTDQVFIPYRNYTVKIGANDTETVYVTIEGNGEATTYSLTSVEGDDTNDYLKMAALIGSLLGLCLLILGIILYQLCKHNECTWCYNKVPRE